MWNGCPRSRELRHPRRLFRTHPEGPRYQEAHARLRDLAKHRRVRVEEIVRSVNTQQWWTRMWSRAQPAFPSSSDGYQSSENFVSRRRMSRVHGYRTSLRALVWTRGVRGVLRGVAETWRRNVSLSTMSTAIIATLDHYRRTMRYDVGDVTNRTRHPVHHAARARATVARPVAIISSSSSRVRLRRRAGT